MKYIEELKYGNIFEYEKQFFILTSCFKKDKKKTYHSCVCINDGNNYWLDSDCMVEAIDIFYQNKENHLININSI
jgi:hypothetical protein